MFFHSIHRWPARDHAGLAAKPGPTAPILVCRLCAAGLIALLLTGCSTPIRGYTAISPKVTGSYQPGVTTHDDILSELGPPVRNSPDDRSIAYVWITCTGTGGGNNFLWYNPPDHYTGVRYHAYCAAFNERQLLVRSEYLVAETADALDTLWQQWQTR